MALGLANSYLKRCVRKGWVKVQQAPANRYLYYLTPTGFAEKSRLTAEYLSTSLGFYREAGNSCAQLLDQCVANNWQRLLLCGVSDLAEIATLRTVLERRTYAQGQIVFEEGDESEELYVVAMGSASARLRLPGTVRQTRLITFSPGTVFGELALLDQESRSATVEADEDLVCYVLDRASFDTLTRQDPVIAIKLLTNLGRELASHLRRANRTIYQLAS